MPTSVEDFRRYPQLRPMYESGAPPLWELKTLGQGVTVALLDSGISRDALPSGQLAWEQDFTGEGTTEEKAGHGSEMAKLVSEYAPKCKIANLRVLDRNGLTTRETVARALDAWYERRAEISIVNMSLSFPRRGLLGARCTDKKRCLVCVKTTRLANSGVMVVAAAGNYGRNVMGCPAVAENTLSVGATVRFPESSWHRFLMRRFTGLYYKLGPENYGTSVACARLSGTLALIRSAIPDLTYAEFTDAVNRAAMLSCADDVTLAGGPGVVGELHGYRTFKLIEHLRAGGPLDLEKAREHWERGRKHFESGRYEQAAREFETATELVPTSHIAFHDLALACHRLGRPRIAEDFLNEAIRLHWAVAAAHNDLGTIFQAGGQLEVALEHYRMALFIEPGLEAAAMNESAVAGALQSRRAGLDRLAKAGAIVLDGPFIQNEQ